MEIHYLPIIICAVLAMVVGAIWYGALFGRLWMRIIGADSLSETEKEAMQKRMWKDYLLQAAVLLLQLYVLAHFIKGWDIVSGVEVAFWLWLGMVMPTLAGSAIWTAESSKMRWLRFVVQAGYQFVIFMLFGYILGNWG
ncbi:DUF1761 domain-containing protein [Candidatus Nomurabacteria bacterium]|nr:DUF1761 domain-containing protein [Candidatus Nomurabacteria bacterium]